jgi:hypothetical protein
MTVIIGDGSAPIPMAAPAIEPGDGTSLAK